MSVELSGIILALIVSVLAPSLLAYFNAHQLRVTKKQEWEQRRVDREAEWKRQDEMAAQAKASADKLAAGQKVQSDLLREQKVHAEKTAELLVSTEKHLDESAKATGAKLEILTAGQEAIHKLVNSNLTEQFQLRLDSTRRELVALRAVAKITQDRGGEVDEEVAGQIASAESTILELRAILNRRRESEGRQEDA